MEKAELAKLEVSCRLNYANVKSKVNEWDICKEQALKVKSLLGSMFTCDCDRYWSWKPTARPTSGLDSLNITSKR